MCGGAVCNTLPRGALFLSSHDPPFVGRFLGFLGFWSERVVVFRVLSALCIKAHG